MKRTATLVQGLIVLALSTTAMTGCNQTPAPAAVVLAQPAKPVLGWKPLSDTTVELGPLEGRTFDVPSQGKLRVSVTAQAGILGGVFPRTVVGRPLPLKFQFAQSSCHLMSVVKGKSTCTLDSASPLVYDVRNTTSEDRLLLGGLFAANHYVKPLAQDTAPNRVEVSIEKWGCVANCGKD